MLDLKCKQLLWSAKIAPQAEHFHQSVSFLPTELWNYFKNKEFIMDIIRILLSILLPPLGVFLQVGIGAHFWINILLTILGYFPGVIHAVYIIAKK